MPCSIEHVLLCCPFYQEICIKLVSPLFDRQSGHLQSLYTNMLLIDANLLVRMRSMKFFVATCKICQLVKTNQIRGIPPKGFQGKKEA